MNRKILCFVLILISFIFISCPSNISTWMVENGQEIKNYPSWATSCNAFSEWMDWQSEDGKRLHHLVDDTIISDEYTGKFRIGLRGQEIIIGFNNQKGNCIKLYNWYGEVSSDYKKIAVHPYALFKYIYCPEGISLREISEDKTKISFNLLDSVQSNYINYFEIQVNSQDDVKILFYREEKETSILINKLEKPEIKFEWLLNFETGETKIY